MSLLRERQKFFLAVAALALPLTSWADIVNTSFNLQSGTSLNFDTGAAAASGGDLLWNGTTLVPQGSAGAVYVSQAGATGYNAFTLAGLQSFPANTYSSLPIPSDQVVANAVFAIHTNGGHYAKMWITAKNGSTLNVQFTTYGVNGGGGGGGPVITAVLNNYSFLPAGLPNSGIAQGSIFVIIGTGLSVDQTPVLQSSTGGLPLTLNQTSLSVTVNNITTHPPLYYTSATAVAGILPSTTPVGDGTMTLTYNGQASVAFPIHVVQSALGLDTLYGTGTGAGTIQDANFNVFSFAKPAKPGQTIILWGSGIGPDPNNDDLNYPQKLNNLTNIPITFYVGGLSADIAYRGRSQYPGLDQLVITIPNDASLGCFVPIVAQEGNVLSNTVTIPISADGGPCSDPVLGFDSTTLSGLAGKTNVNVGAIIAGQTTDSTGTTNSVTAVFQRTTGSKYGSGYNMVSEGACLVEPPAPNGGLFMSTGLDAGNVTATASTGQVMLTTLVGKGFYYAGLPAGAITGTGGSISIAGAGGADVGMFSTSVNLQNPLVWNNQAALTSIDRTQGGTVTWTGGFPNSTVEVTGTSSIMVNGTNQTVTFYCQAPASAGKIVIPPSVTLALPAGSGYLDVTNSTTPKTFSASGLDYGYALGSVSVQNNATYH